MARAIFIDTHRYAESKIQLREFSISGDSTFGFSGVKGIGHAQFKQAKRQLNKMHEELPKSATESACGFRQRNPTDALQFGFNILRETWRVLHVRHYAASCCT